MTEFMETFEETKKKDLEAMDKLERTIAALLEHMSKNIGRQTNLPSRDKVNELREDLEHKINQVENAETTFARLKVEVEQRNADLEKINSLEVKINKETSTMNEKLDKMQDEIDNKFTKIDQIKSGFDKEKRRLQEMKTILAKVQPGLAKQMTFHSMKHDTKKNQILQNDLYKTLNELEKRLINNEGQVYSMRQFIEAKGAESNFQHQLTECMNLVSELNMEVVKKSLAIHP